MTSELLMLRNSIESQNNQLRETARASNDALHKVQKQKDFDEILQRMDRLRKIARSKGSANVRSKRLQTSFCF